MAREWYGKWRARCGIGCRVPECLAWESQGDEVLIVLEGFDALDDLRLKRAAHGIDARLNACPCQTVGHGDAKLVNFCFADSGGGVAAVDFQYVGGGCGMKDVAYFIGSCLDEAQCAARESALLDSYFGEFDAEVERRGKKALFAEVERSWLALYPFALTDFHRFLKRWSPGHWKLNSYSERLARETVERLESESGGT